MLSSVTQLPALKLSICIGTYNRASFIGETLDSIISQATNDCEIVVSDNASTDDTAGVVAERMQRFERLHYIKQDNNKGIDRNYDRTIELASGEYCWLMSDDDLLRPGAVARVLCALRRDLSLLIVNLEYRDFSMLKVIKPSSMDFDSDRFYGRDEMDRLFTEVGSTLMYIGNIILKRSIWLQRERQRYYDSLFIHVGMIFQERLPGDTMVIAEPLISYRWGNAHSYSPTANSSTASEILFMKWPLLVESLAISKAAKRKVRTAEPWRSPQWLLYLRGGGIYSLLEYRRWLRPRLGSLRERAVPVIVAMLPGVVVNTILVIYYSVRGDRNHFLQVMKESRFHLRNWQVRRRQSVSG